MCSSSTPGGCSGGATRTSGFVSLFPASASFAMPGRIALGVAAWWEPILAAALTLAATAGLVAVAGRVYTGAILHTGATLKLRDAWRRTTTPGRCMPESDTRPLDTAPQTSLTSAERREGDMTRRDTTTDRSTIVVLLLALVIGAAVAVAASDVMIGVAVGAAFYAVATRVATARAGHDDRHDSHR